jgi:hypothetical protein
MRKIFIIFILFSLFSCEKIFHEGDVDLSDLSDKNSMMEALNGMYNRLARLVRAFYFTQIINGDDLTYIFYSNRTSGIPPDENGRFIFSTHLHTFGSHSFIYTDKDIQLMMWQYIYNTIISANNIIDQYVTGKLEKQFSSYVGEAYFVRAYCFFKLVRLFGKGPLVTGVDVDYTLPCSGPEEIYRVIEDDLLMAMEILPENNTSSRIKYVTPHRGTAKTLLAEVYLFMAGYPLKDDSKYMQAAKLAGEVIDSNVFFGYGLLPDYENVWSGLNNCNEESVFSLFYDLTYHTSLDYFLVTVGNSIIEPLEIKVFEGRPIITEVNFYNNFPRDYRRDVTFMNRLIGNHYEKIPIFDSETGDLSFTIIDSVFFDHYYDTIGFGDNIVFLKNYLSIRNLPLGQNGSYNVINYDEKVNDENTSLYIFRYPHVLLTYAEAKARSGQLDASAYEAVNMVRRRANKVDVLSSSEYDLSPGLSAEQFADSVVQERAWEFCGEMEGRWFDLIRLEMVEKLPELRHPRETGPPKYPITKEDYYLPIPEEAAIWF